MPQILRRIGTSLVDFLTTFLQQATAQGTRSTILTPLGWFFGLSLAGLLGSVHASAEFWIQVMLATFCVLGAATYLCTYVYCIATKQPKLLQTEKFQIQQMAIEKGWRGDSENGIVVVKDGEPPPPLLPQGGQAK